MRQQIPDQIPAGMGLFIIVADKDSRKKKYLHSIQRPAEEFGQPKINLAPTKSLARVFLCVQLARDFCRFLHKVEGIDIDFELSMEAYS
jgi:hypothetical protein